MGALTTNIAVSNAALSLIGEPRIEIIDASTIAGRILDETYEAVVQSAIVSYRFRFALVTSSLVRLDEAPGGAFSAAYQEPSGALAVHGVFVNGAAITFDRFGSEIHCNASVSDAVTAIISYRAPEAAWSPMFTQGIVERLAGDLSISIQEQAGKARDFWSLAAQTLAAAADQEAQNRTARVMDTKQFIRARRR